MTASINQKGKSSSVPAGLAIGASVSMAVTAVCSAMIAIFLNRENLTWDQAGYWIMGMLFLASFVGGKCAFGAIKRQRLLVSLMAGMLYWGILLCMTALFFGGKFEAVGETAALIGAGAGTAALISSPIPPKNRRKKGRGYR